MDRFCFEKLVPHIYRLKVPFENIYTAVFLIKTDDGCALLDCAASAHDTESVIVPALDACGIDRKDIKYILISHPHGDHAGGLRALLPLFPSAVVCAGSEYLKNRLEIPNFRVLSDGQMLLSCIEAVSLPGHCADMYGFYDKRSKALITGDALQLCGVGRYGCGLSSYSDYMATLDRVQNMDIESLVASHDYYPLGAIAHGKEQTAQYISECRRYAHFISEHIDKQMSVSNCDKKLVCDIIREENNRRDPNIPPLQYSTVEKYIMSRIQE
ncbi:MAG: MBL fold metallo-hydrolase [Clostridia bacterium]|nr:MBL fold metallo-hydrolase [Clostridia bacterium]